MLKIERPWTRQPQGVARINWGNPIANGVVFATSFGAGPFDLFSNRLATPYGGIGQGVGRNGRGAAVNSANKAYEWSADPFAKNAGTIAVLSTVLASGTADGCIFAVTSSADSGVAPYIALAVKTNGSGGVIAQHSFGGVSGTITPSYTNTVGASELIALRAAPVGEGSQTVSIYSNGVLAGAAGANISGSLTYSAGRRFVVGEDYRLASRNSNRNIELAVAWDRRISDHELDAFVRNPWQLFAPRRIWVPVTAAPTGPTVTALLRQRSQFIGSGLR